MEKDIEQLFALVWDDSRYLTVRVIVLVCISFRRPEIFSFRCLAAYQELILPLRRCCYHRRRRPM